MNFYGIPMQQSSVGLSTFYNYMENGGKGAERVILDDELSSVIFALTEVQEEQYRKDAEKVAAEQKIKRPADSKCASFSSYVAQWCSVAVDTVIQFASDLAEFVGSLATAGISGLSKGLSGLMPLLIIAAVICVFIFLK